MSEVAQRWSARSRTVTHERLDDEVIAIDLESGVYFAMDGPAADVWTLAVSGIEVQAIVQLLADRYQVVDAAVRDDVHDFLAVLAEERLIVPVDCDAAPQPAADEVLPSRAGDAPWATPVLERYDDMADLVLLDPIHQVDESGWPHLPPDP